MPFTQEDGHDLPSPERGAVVWWVQINDQHWAHMHPQWVLDLEEKIQRGESSVSFNHSWGKKKANVYQIDLINMTQQNLTSKTKRRILRTVVAPPSWDNAADVVAAPSSAGAAAVTSSSAATAAGQPQQKPWPSWKDDERGLKGVYIRGESS